MGESGSCSAAGPKEPSLFSTCTSSRVALLGVEMAARELQLINAYIPQSGRPEEERQQAFDE
eukprot:15070215-Alexandrium_andersonii.AAC.1